MPKFTTFQVKSLAKLHEPNPSNPIPRPLFTYLLLSLLFTILVPPNKQFFDIKFLSGFLANYLNNRPIKYLQFWSRNCFVLQLKLCYQIVFLLSKDCLCLFLKSNVLYVG